MNSFCEQAVTCLGYDLSHLWNDMPITGVPRMKPLLFAAMAAFAAAPALAADKYMLDSSHSQIVFSYDHLGYSTTYGMFS